MLSRLCSVKSAGERPAVLIDSFQLLEVDTLGETDKSVLLWVVRVMVVGSPSARLKEERMHDQLRRLSLLQVLANLGVSTQWKTRKDGTEYYGQCPLHEAKRNQTSFSFDVEGRFHCFSCEKKGRGAIDLVMAVRQVGFQEAVSYLQTFVGSPAFLTGARKPAVRQVQEMPAANEPFKATYEKFAVESSWLKERGLTPETLKHFEVFEYNNPKRKSAYSGSVMLKIRRYSDGECVGYLSRNIGEVTAEKPKYLFPKGLHKGLELFGAWQIKNEVQAQLPLRLVYLVESPFSVMKFHQLGLPAVSPYGWSVSPQQVEILKQLAKGIVFLPDRNKHAEASQSVGTIAASLWVKSPELPAGIDDPESLSVEQVRQLT